MKSDRSKLLSLMFFLSGFCGLLYQVVWVRMAFAHFGITTPVLSVILSTFMLGLSLGSWAGGRFVGPLSRRFKCSPLVLYAIAEATIGVGAFLVPALFGWGEKSLLPTGDIDSFSYLLSSALVIAASILPWCLFMGTTFPLVMAFIKERDPSQSSGFSYLYLANVLGAMTGTLITALVLIETLGFHKTLLVAGLSNFSIALMSLWLARASKSGPVPAEKSAKTAAKSRSPEAGAQAPYLARLILFTTGFVSMAMEVAWTRAFTPVIRTTVYAFAGILFVYLLATYLGSRRYRLDLDRKKVVPTARLLAWLAVAAFLPIVLTDPNLNLRVPGVVISLFPFCALLGYLTPKIIDRISAGRPEGAGSAYAMNVLGCILGPLAASYLFLPWLGVKLTLILLALPLLGFQWAYAGSKGLKPAVQRRFAFASAVLLVGSTALSHSYEEHLARREHGVVRRDHTATVVSLGEGMQRRLLVNGIGITSLTPLTKVMAHLPLSYRPDKPEAALMICFGMGTTFRSLLSWNIDATAVELVPSVKDAFGYYHNDTAQVLANPRGHIVIDDGRRYLRRSSATYNVITLDPPPPVEASGSSLLYSKEFYDLVRSHLKKGGILQQWFPGSPDKKILAAVARSLNESFPYVRVYASIDEWGHHFIASMEPLTAPTADEMIARMPEAARKDLMEWYPDRQLPELATSILSKEVPMSTLLAMGPADGSAVRVMDDRPYNEYFVLRRLWASMK